MSDICLESKPGVFRSYRLVLGSFSGKLLATYIVATFGFIIGLVLLIVPGVIFLTWVLFSVPVVILEGRWGLKALVRSKELGRGYYWRNGAIAVAFVLTELLIEEVLRQTGNSIAGKIAFVEGWAIQMCLVPLSELFSPIFSIAVILMYYDLRVRKEAYNNVTLAEDLRH